MSRHQDAADPELLVKFTSLLSSAQPVTLPRQTVLGAISHYISTTSTHELEPLMEAISTSDYLWQAENNRTIAREALALGVSGAIDRLAAQPGSSRWWKRRDAMSLWLDGLSEQIKESGGEYRLHVLVAVLAGVTGRGGLEWSGKAREGLEEEIIMGIAQQMDPVASVDVGLFCDVLRFIDGDKIRVLDTKTVQSVLLEALEGALARPTSNSHVASSVAPEILSRAIARLLSVLDAGDLQERYQAWSAMPEFCAFMRRIGSRLPLLASTESGNAPGNDKEAFEQHKTALFAFLLPSATTLSILLHSDPPTSANPDTASPLKADIAAETLHTLSGFASILDQSEGGLEGYHKVLHGMTDILVASGGPVAVRDLFTRAPAADVCTPAEGSWWLPLGESIIRQVDGRTYEELVEPMIRRFVESGNHRPSFEAAHSLRLAAIQAAADNLESSSTARDTFQDQASTYADLLIHQYSDNKLTNDQFRSAYPLLIESASKHSDDLIDTCIDHLRQARAPSASPEIFGQTRRLALISSAPHIAAARLRPYLDSLAREITSTPAMSNMRIELTGAAFRMIMHDLGDNARMTGMEWWTDWRDIFEEKRSVRGDAKL